MELDLCNYKKISKMGRSTVTCDDPNTKKTEHISNKYTVSSD